MEANSNPSPKLPNRPRVALFLVQITRQRPDLGSFHFLMQRLYLPMQREKQKEKGS
jgi:hypothetical protein